MTTRRRNTVAAAFCWTALLLARPAAAKDRTLTAPELDPVITGKSAPAAAAPAAGTAGSEVPGSPLTIDVPDACAASIRKKCPGAFAGVRELRACLNEGSNNISDYCKGAIEVQLPGGAAAAHAAAKPARPRKPANAAQARAAVMNSCRRDAAEFCSDVPQTKAEILGCLKAYATQASEPCAAALSVLAGFEEK